MTLGNLAVANECAIEFFPASGLLALLEKLSNIRYCNPELTTLIATIGSMSGHQSIPGCWMVWSGIFSASTPLETIECWSIVMSYGGRGLSWPVFIFNDIESSYVFIWHLSSVLSQQSLPVLAINVQWNSQANLTAIDCSSSRNQDLNLIRALWWLVPSSHTMSLLLRVPSIETDSGVAPSTLCHATQNNIEYREPFNRLKDPRAAFLPFVDKHII